MIEKVRDMMLEVKNLLANAKQGIEGSISEEFIMEAEGELMGLWAYLQGVDDKIKELVNL